jgi:hypothetical protein
MSLSRLTFLCHSNLLTSICCIHFDKIACNHRGIIETRCEYHGGFLGNFNWTVAIISRIESGSWWARIELSLWKMMSSIILSSNILRMTSDQSCLAKHRYGQSSWSKNCAELSMILLWILPCCLLFWGHISSFNETYIFFVSLLFWKHEMFSLKVILTKYFDQAPTCD